MPLGDWQFWIVSLAMLAALWFLLRPLLPRRRKASRVRRAGATLTVKGRPPTDGR